MESRTALAENDEIKLGNLTKKGLSFLNSKLNEALEADSQEQTMRTPKAAASEIPEVGSSRYVYCSSCGSKLAAGTKFCPECGTPQNRQFTPPLEQPAIQVDPEQAIPARNTKRENVYEGVIHKCPNCGQVLDAFSAACPSCGYEFRDSKANSSLHELSLKLQEITARSDRSKKQTPGEWLRRDSSNTDDQAAALIKAFPIPNTKENLIEFIIVSASNVNADSFNELKNGSLSSSEIAMSNAWLAKLEQAYQKASIMLSDDASFVKIQEVYDKTTQKVLSAKRAEIRSWIVLGLVLVTLMAFLFIMSIINPEW